MIILFLTRNLFADAGTIGEDEEEQAIDDGPGPASAVIMDTCMGVWLYSCIDLLNTGVYMPS